MEQARIEHAHNGRLLTYITSADALVNNYHMPIDICHMCIISRTKYIISIEISDIFRSKYCFFLNPHTWSLLRHAQSRVRFCIARIFEFDRSNLYLQKSQRHGKVHQGTFTQNRVEGVLVPKCRSKCK